MLFTHGPDNRRLWQSSHRRAVDRSDFFHGRAVMYRGLMRRPPFALLFAAVWLIVAFGLLVQHWPDTARTVPDADDAMRLVQVRAFLAGQNWFDLHEARIAPPFGYDTHWSRLIDAGLAGVLAILHGFADGATAERLLGLIGEPAFTQFRPGRIDHHNVQIALSILILASVAWSDRRHWCASAAGGLTGLALGVGLEGLPYLAARASPWRCAMSATRVP